MSEFGVRAAGAVLGVGLLIGAGSGCTVAEQPPESSASEMPTYNQIDTLTIGCVDVEGIGSSTQESCDAAAADVRKGIELLTAVTGKEIPMKVGVVMLKKAITPVNPGGRCADILTPEGKAQVAPFLDSITNGGIPQFDKDASSGRNAAYIAVNATGSVCPEDIRTIHGVNNSRPGVTSITQLFGPNHEENANRAAHELFHSGENGIGHDTALTAETNDPYHLKGDETKFNLKPYGTNSIMGDYKQGVEPYLAAPHALQLGVIKAEQIPTGQETEHTLTTHVPGEHILQAGPVLHRGILKNVQRYVHGDTDNLRYYVSRSRGATDESQAGADVYIALTPEAQKDVAFIFNLGTVDAKNPNFVDEASGISVTYERSSDQGAVVKVLDR
ncbi:MAG: hypothetical protein ABWX94_01210 [Candidatus Saccharimonadales bacterium]